MNHVKLKIFRLKIEDIQLVTQHENEYKEISNPYLKFSRDKTQKISKFEKINQNLPTSWKNPNSLEKDK